jgi:hypothetical protein
MRSDLTSLPFGPATLSSKTPLAPKRSNADVVGASERREKT